VVPVNGHNAEHNTAHVHQNDLAKKANQPNDDKNVIVPDAVEHIALIVYLAAVDFIEQGHDDEDVEYDGEVNARLLEFLNVVVQNDIVHVHPSINLRETGILKT
jgi:hypothetical protein